MVNLPEVKDSKILLTAIFKGDSEYELARRMLESFMPYCHGLVIAITKESKSPKLSTLIHKYKGHVIITTPKTHPSIYTDGEFTNFAEARNVTFQYADSLKGYDWYLWADVDDILIGGKELQSVANKALTLHVDSVLFTYWYAIRLKKDNTFSEQDIMIEHLKDRLLKPHIFKWVSRLHEVPVSKDDNYKPAYTAYAYDTKTNQTIAWAHLSNTKRFETNALRNIKILKLQLEEEKGKDPRTLSYLGKSYFDLNTPENDKEALKLFSSYLKLSGWAEERAVTWQYIGQIFVRQNDHQKAILAYHKAAEVFPNLHMTYLNLAKEYAEVKEYDKSHFWLDVAMKMDPPTTRTTIGNPLEIKWLAASLAYNEAQRKLDLDQAIYWLKIRLELGQHKEEDEGMLKTLEEAKLLNEAGKWVFNYAKWLKDTGHKDKVSKLLEALTPELGREAFVSYIANEVKEPKVWDKKSVAYYASWGADHFESWSPKSISKGIGGSERAVIELAKRWVKAGYDVTVFGDPQDDEGDYEGVHYRPWYEINWNDTFHTLILWRSPHLLDKEIKAYNLYMDLHDVASQIDWTDKRMERIDKVFFKSLYHRSMLPKLPDSKAVIISNGITL